MSDKIVRFNRCLCVHICVRDQQFVSYASGKCGQNARNTGNFAAKLGEDFFPSHAKKITESEERNALALYSVTGSQTHGLHVARESVLCGPRCFLEFSNN